MATMDDGTLMEDFQCSEH